LLQDLGYKSLKADPDVWMHKAVKTNGHKYYEMLFMYVDDILALSHQATVSIQEITNFLKAKDGSIKPPKIYLGADVARIQLPNGHEVWSTSPCTYVKNSILVVEQLLEEDSDGYVLKMNAHNPFPTASEGAKTRYSKKSEKNLKIRCLLQNSEHFCLQVLEKS
jgi:hypothetical protein